MPGTSVDREATATLTEDVPSRPLPGYRSSAAFGEARWAHKKIESAQEIANGCGDAVRTQ